MRSTNRGSSTVRIPGDDTFTKRILDKFPRVSQVFCYVLSRSTTVSLFRNVDTYFERWTRVPLKRDFNIFVRKCNLDEQRKRSVKA